MRPVGALAAPVAAVVEAGQAQPLAARPVRPSSRTGDPELPLIVVASWHTVQAAGPLSPMNSVGMPGANRLAPPSPSSSRLSTSSYFDLSVLGTYRSGLAGYPAAATIPAARYSLWLTELAERWRLRMFAIERRVRDAKHGEIELLMIDRCRDRGTAREHDAFHRAAVERRLAVPLLPPEVEKDIRLEHDLVSSNLAIDWAT